MDSGDPVVRTGSGSVRGRVEDGVAVFRGIPFAQPPVGPLRFAAPEPVPAWDGIRDAADFGPPPPQSALLPLLLPAPSPDENPDNWLTVNVWSPDPGRPHPVMVWIYGGAYRMGTASQGSYDGSVLARQGVVLVTFNYRVAVEGFAQLPGAPANRGLLDQVAALRWVQQNIAQFGGDPGNVTVFGESAGAGSVACLLVMPSAAGLFGRAIAQSVPGPFLSPGLATRITAAIAAEAGIAAALDAFQATAPQALAAASDAVRPREHPEWGLVSYGDVPFAPVVDGEVLPSTPWQAVAAGAARDVDLLTGHNRDEYRLFLEFGGLRGTISDEQATRELDALLEDGDRLYRLAYPEATAEQLYELVNSDWLFRIPTLHLAQAHAAAGGRTYLYELLYDATPLGACHALDVPLVFGAYKELGEFLLGNPPPDAAVQLGNLMRAEWVEFARTGDPGWSPYSIGRRLTRIYNENPDVVPYPEHASMHLWDQRRLGILDVAEGVSSGADLRTGRV
jgi:para-nitrobenzyl esterase